MVKEIVALKQGTKEWLDYRKSHITATDIAPIMGVCPWSKTAYTLFFEKRSDSVETPKSNYQEWGSRLEPAVIDKVVESLNLRNVVRGKCYEDGWKMASLDAEADWYNDDHPFSEHVIIEAKTTSHKDGWWDAEGNETIPLHYQLQAIWQMIVTGHRKVVFTCLMTVGLEWWYRVMEWDEEMANAVLSNADYFHGCLAVGQTPAFLPQKYSASAEAEYKLRMEKMAEDTKPAKVTSEAVEEYRLAKQLADEATLRYKNAYATLTEQLSTCKVGEVEEGVTAVKVVKSGRGYTLKLK